MKKISFLVTLLAMLQVVVGMRSAQAQDRLNDRDRRTVEEALDRAGEDIGAELEELFEQLGVSAEKMGESLERWTEENSDRIEEWSNQHGDEWEAFGEQLGQKMERIAEEQEFVWSQWANRYERNLEKWAGQLEQRGELNLNAENIDDFIEGNLEMLSEMPLGQLVDQALEDGLGELKNAPWESLGELGEMAHEAFQEPMEQISDALDSDNEDLKLLRRSSGKMFRSLEELKQDVERNLSDDRDLAPERSTQEPKWRDLFEGSKSDNPKIQALERLLQNRDDLSDAQRERVKQAIKTLQDAESAIRDKQRQRRQLDVPKRDQIMERIEREKQRHKDALRAFNDDLDRSSEESKRFDEWRDRDQLAEMQRAREMENRRPKGVDGKSNLDRNDGLRFVPKTKNDTSRSNRDRDPRSNSNFKSRPTQKGSDKSKTSNAETENNDPVPGLSELELLRRELETLKKEIQRLKDKDK